VYTGERVKNMSNEKITKDQIIAAYDKLCKKSFIETCGYKSKDEKTKPTGARLPESLHEKMVNITQNENTTMNYLINIAVFDLICKYEKFEVLDKTTRAEWIAEFSKKSEAEQLKMLFEKM